MRRLPLLIGLIAVAGCGGGGSSSGGISQEAFTKRANALCDSYKARISRVPRPKGTRNIEQVVLYLDRTLPLARQLTTAIARLPRPKKQATDIARFVAALRQEVDAVDRARSDAKAQNEVAMRKAFAESTLATHIAVRNATRLGLTACGPSSAR